MKKIGQIVESGETPFGIYVNLTSFIGLQLAAPYGLVDTGAQNAVTGPKGIKRIRALLARHGLKPRKVATNEQGACGVGGAARCQ